jgi:hypothetical protein
MPAGPCKATRHANWHGEGGPLGPGIPTLASAVCFQPSAHRDDTLWHFTRLPKTQDVRYDVAEIFRLQTAAPTDDAAARAARLARKNAKAERIRKQRLARARARALGEAAARQPSYGYAPYPTFGPFGAFGRVQRW